MWSNNESETSNSRCLTVRFDPVTVAIAARVANVQSSHGAIAGRCSIARRAMVFGSVRACGAKRSRVANVACKRTAKAHVSILSGSFAVVCASTVACAKLVSNGKSDSTK